MSIFTRKDALTLGTKHTNKGLSLFDSAIARLEKANAHLHQHAEVAQGAADILLIEADQAKAQAQKNAGAIERLASLVHG